MRTKPSRTPKRRRRRLPSTANAISEVARALGGKCTTITGSVLVAGAHQFNSPAQFSAAQVLIHANFTRLQLREIDLDAQLRLGRCPSGDCRSVLVIARCCDF